MSDMKRLLYVSNDFIKRRPHIHYLMREYDNNSRAVVATYDSKQKRLTVKPDAFEFLSDTFKLFIEYSNKDGENNANT